MHDDRTRGKAREQEAGCAESRNTDPLVEERKVQRGVLSHVLSEHPALTSDAEIEAVLLPSGATGFGEYVARWIESRRIHYCWGGGHGAEPGPSGGSYCWSAAGEQIFGAGEDGLDCSGAVRWLLVLSGYPDPGGLVSNELGARYPAGPGRAVTIWSNAAHIWIEIAGRDWGTSSANFAHGPAFSSQSSAGFVASHPAGL